MNLWDLISNPPDKTVQGIHVPAWKVPELEDRKAMVEALEDDLREKAEYLNQLRMSRLAIWNVLEIKEKAE